MNTKNVSVLKSVEKPGRYSAGEFGQTIKDKTNIKARWASWSMPVNYSVL